MDSDAAALLAAARVHKENAAEALRISELELSLIGWQKRLHEMEERLRRSEQAEAAAWSSTASPSIADAESPTARPRHPRTSSDSNASRKPSPPQETKAQETGTDTGVGNTSLPGAEDTTMTTSQPRTCAVPVTTPPAA